MSRLLNLSLCAVCRVIFWTVGLDPIFSAIFASVPAYFFGVWFTENVFAQKPAVVQATCPDCQYIFPIFFGDLFSVMTDGIVPGGAPGSTQELKCPNCKIDLTADRDLMILSGKPKSMAGKPVK